MAVSTLVPLSCGHACLSCALNDDGTTPTHGLSPSIVAGGSAWWEQHLLLVCCNILVSLYLSLYVGLDLSTMPCLATPVLCRYTSVDTRQAMSSRRLDSGGSGGLDLHGAGNRLPGLPALLWCCGQPCRSLEGCLDPSPRGARP